MVTTTTAELVYDAAARTAESPTWDPRTGKLRWVDIPAGAVHELDPTTGIDTRFDVGMPVGAVIPRERGGLLLVVADGFATCDTDGSGLTFLAHVVVPVDGGRMNDGACDPTGRVWAGSMHPHADGKAALYRLDERAAARQVLHGVGLSNGLGWSPDAHTFYYADTPTGRIDSFDVDLELGTLAHRRPFVTLERGAPDGLCIDADGCVWVALWNGGAVQKFTPEGALDRTVELPVTRVTSCGFGGHDLCTLFVTTAQGRTDQRTPEPHAGGIFALRTKTPGLPSAAWAG